ncbi:hypothetical protein D049_0523B, partial [Vibrio parahaemolyticus VPTS-2010]
PIAITDFEQIF